MVIRTAHPAHPQQPRSHEPVSNEVIEAAGRRVELRRSGARLSLTVHGRPLNEDQARIIALPHIDPGERLLDAVHDDPAVDFTFVVWPRPLSHTASMLEQLRAA